MADILQKKTKKNNLFSNPLAKHEITLGTFLFVKIEKKEFPVHCAGVTTYAVFFAGGDASGAGVPERVRLV